MRLLLVADANSVWTKRYVENVAMKLNYDISLLSTTNTEFTAFYSENNIRVYSFACNNGRLIKSKIIRNVVSLFKIVRLLWDKKYDVIHFNFVFPVILKLLSFINVKNYILTFWGSDLLRTDSKEMKKREKAIKGARYITLMTTDMEIFFREIYGTEYNDKMSVLPMGLSTLNYIDLHRGNRSTCREAILEKYANRISISVGYNANPNQQHIKILEQLAKLPEKIKDQIILILPLTYSRSDVSYLERVKKTAIESGIEVIIREKFLNDDEMSRLCLSTDFFINAQTTDAISGTMLELIYSGTIAINASWLKYSYLDVNNVYYIQFNDFSEINDKLQYCLNNRNSFNNNASTCIGYDFSWKYILERWKEIYEFVNKGIEGTKV